MPFHMKTAFCNGLKRLLNQPSNYIDITGAYDPDTGFIKLFSAQDNLGKGAALQAIQAFNVMFGFPEETGLKTLIRGV